ASSGPASSASPASSGRACSASSPRRRRNTLSSLSPLGFVPGCRATCPRAAVRGALRRWPLRRRMPPGRAEPAVAAGRARERGDLVEHRQGHPQDDKLGDPVTAPAPDRPRPVGVEQGYLDLATVPGVHGTWRVDDGDPVPGGQARARVHERRIAIGQRDRHPGGHHRAFPRPQRHVRRRAQVHPGVTRVRPRGQRQAPVEALDEHRDGVHGGAGGRRVPGRRAAGSGLVRGHAGDPTPAAPLGLAGPRRPPSLAPVPARTGWHRTAPRPAPPWRPAPPPPASTRMIASGWKRTIRPTTSGCSRWLSSWFSSMKIATRTRAATQPRVARVTATARVPATRMPTSGTNAARKTKITSGTSNGTPMTQRVVPITTAWIAATAMVPRTSYVTACHAAVPAPLTRARGSAPKNDVSQAHIRSPSFSRKNVTNNISTVPATISRKILPPETTVPATAD